MQAGDNFRKLHRVLGSPPKARHPGKGALLHPAPRLPDNAMVGLQQFEHLQATAVRRRVESLAPQVRAVDAAVTGRVHLLEIVLPDSLTSLALCLWLR